MGVICVMLRNGGGSVAAETCCCCCCRLGRQGVDVNGPGDRPRNMSCHMGLSGHTCLSGTSSDHVLYGPNSGLKNGGSLSLGPQAPTTQLCLTGATQPGIGVCPSAQLPASLMETSTSRLGNGGSRVITTATNSALASSKLLCKIGLPSYHAMAGECFDTAGAAIGSRANLGAGGGYGGGSAETTGDLVLFESIIGTTLKNAEAEASTCFSPKPGILERNGGTRLAGGLVTSLSCGKRRQLTGKTVDDQARLTQ
ncbi:unnamed protein product [Protopolystoma xenopodis]|uniref:Uncharacterized protein n=1 Tax=Protopolystoma xenopodis TaxID=117903 RepID=A0A3S5BRP5_9PLAT|nr:unnamed protein product [Protopolystoma xenopodis]